MNLPGYTIIEEIYNSTNSNIYLAKRNVDDCSVVIKMPSKEHLTAEDIAKFNLEFEICKDLGIDGVINMYSIDKHNNKHYITMELFDGHSLNKRIQSGKIGLEEFLHIAIKTVETIGEIHNKNIIHKDINPTNILWNAQTGNLKIIDFGISSRLSHETQYSINPQGLEGSLHYISPEQTGRMNRSIDYRTDYYSLGVTFYELITQQKPFISDDLLEIVHFHIAKLPKSPFEINPDIPKVISDIISKLMSKNSEDRYQSSFGIKSDLQRCLDSYTKTRKIDDFQIGQKDISERFELPQKLYGREKETKALIAGFENVNQFGFCEMMLVTGLSGIGKSSLVHEIHKHIANKKAHLISGKFDQLTRNSPYLPLINAFGEIIQNILTTDEEQLIFWRTRILEAVGGIGQVIINIIPQLEIIIGKQPELPDLEPIKAQNRFNMVFQNFVKSLASKEYPLIIFIDDLQWADSGSLKMIEMFMTNPDIKHIYFIGAFRSNKVDKTHPLMITVEEIKKAGRNIDFINLDALVLEDVILLISETFYASFEKSQTLAEICIQKTQGNPFFLNQFLKCLYQENLIQFEIKNGIWEWDIKKISKKGMTDNVLTLMTDKIQQLSDKAQNILKLSSCLGNEFDLTTLSIINEKSQIETSEDLWPALSEGLLLPIENKYKQGSSFVNDENNNPVIKYKFLHDKVQQAAYALMEVYEKKRVHLKIGYLMLENSSKENMEDKDFDIVNHLNIGLDLITDKAEKEKLARLNFLAGKKAKQSSAYDICFRYSKTGVGLLGIDNWINQYDLSLDLYSQSADVAYLCGNFEEMEVLIEKILQNSKTLVDKLKAYEIKILSFVSQNNKKEALNTCIYALSLAGIKIPSNPKMKSLIFGFIKISLLLRFKKHEDIMNLPKMKDELLLTVMRILRITSPSAYNVNLKVWALLGFQILRLTLKHGTDVATVIGFGIYTILVFGTENIGFGLKWGRIFLQSFEKIGTAEIKSFCLAGYSIFASHYDTPIKDTLPTILEAYIAGLETGDIEFAGISLFSHLYHGFAMGNNLVELEKEGARNTATLRKMNQSSSLLWTQVYHQTVLNLLGKSKNPYSIITGIRDVEKELQSQIDSNITFAYLLLFNEMYLNFLFYRFEDAKNTSVNMKKYKDGATSLIVIPLSYFYEALTYLSLYNECTKFEQIKILVKVKIYKKLIKNRAHYASMTHLHRYFLIEAELSRVNGDNINAIDYYNKAIQLAAQNEYLNDEALANELAARFYFSIGSDKVGYIYMFEARVCYERWGAKAKVNHLDETYPELKNGLKNKINLNFTTSIPSISSTTMTSSDLFDITSIMKASQAISGEIEYVKLIEKLMKVVMENAGAQKIILLTKKENKFILEAEYNLGDIDVTIALLKSNIEYNDEKKFAVSIINFVERTKNTFVLSATNANQFENDIYLKENNPKSILCMPFIHQDNISRILYMENNTTKGAFTHDRIKILSLLSSQMVISIENSCLYKRAVTDGLTQISNRAFFDNHLMQSVYEAQRYNRQLSLLLIDIDHFKNFNDTYGHQIGDLVLKVVATTMITVIRKCDLASRYGGEEFVIVLAETGLDGAKVVADKVRQAIEDSSIEYGYGENTQQLKVTVSIGVASLEQNDNRITLIERADQNMYKAKESGRNRIAY